MELWLRAGELGFAMAYYTVGVVYFKGEGVRMNMKKAKHYTDNEKGRVLRRAIAKRHG